MKRLLFVLAILAAYSLPADAARQVVALFPPEVLPATGDNVLLPAVPILEKALKEKLGERFDVRSPASPIPENTEEARRGKARSLGASYIVGGTLSRIGKGVTLDVTLAPVEDPGKGRTVVVSDRLEDLPAGSERYVSLFRGLGSEAARRMSDLFFGTGGHGGSGVLRFDGTISRSSAIPGEVVSVAMSDLDRDGKMEVAAAYDSGIVVYGLEGDDLREEARIPEAGPGLFHLDARDIDRDGVAEILSVRFAGSKVLSDIWRYDEKGGYRRIASDLPFILRTADLGPEGIVLLGQETDPARIYRGPVNRMTFDPSGSVAVSNRDGALPLPEGTFILAFTPLRWKDEIRYAVLSSRDRIVYLDSAGKELWEGLDAFAGTDVALPAMQGKLRLPV
ncbi:MAG: VCBS repeat-containing protein, partial [Thermodesulfobacteriota bacterium]